MSGGTGLRQNLLPTPTPSINPPVTYTSTPPQQIFVSATASDGLNPTLVPPKAPLDMGPSYSSSYTNEHRLPVIVYDPHASELLPYYKRDPLDDTPFGALIGNIANWFA